MRMIKGFSEAIFKATFLSVLVIAGQIGSRASPVFAAPSEAAPAETKEPVGDPRSKELNEAGVSAVRSKDIKKAEELFRRAIDVDKHNLAAVFNLAGMLITNKRESEAVSLLEVYAAEVPDDAGLRSRLGDAYFATKQVDKAAAAYETAMKLDPEAPHIPGRLATIYLLSNDTAKAEALLMRAVELNPKDAQLLSNLSSVFLANKKPDRAVATAKRGIQLKPTQQLYLTLGAAYEAEKDLKNSLISYQRAASLGDKSPELTEKIKELEAKVKV